jgi:predicted phage terminase large subunit-like protein
MDLNLTPIPESLYAIPSRSTSWPLPDSPDSPAYGRLIEAIKTAPLLEAAELFRAACVNDFYFFNRWCLSLGSYLCDDSHLTKYYRKPWIEHPWLFERCREIQESPDGHLDLWPRFHFKTTLITQNLTLWEFLTDPDLKVGIGTHKIDMTGEAMVNQMRREVEKNERLKWHFPATFYWDPEKESQEWGAMRWRLRQHGTPREPSVMIFSVVGALPTSFHFDRIILDDLVVEKSIANREAIETTTEGWRRTAGLCGDETRRRYVGTHWAHNDSYKYMLNIGAVSLRYHDVYGPDGSTPVLRSKQWLEGDGTSKNFGMRAQMGAVNFAAQMRNKPSLGSVQSFNPSKISYYDEAPEQLLNRVRPYFLLDTAASRTKDSDFNAGLVIGVGRGVPLPHVYVLDMLWDRMSLPDLDDAIFEKAEKWKPWWTFIEQMGAQRDVEHLRGEMQRRGYQFRLKAIEPKDPKEQRILRLQIPFDQNRVHFPRHLFGRHNGRQEDLIRRFFQDELLVWTAAAGADHDDMLEVLSHAFLPELKAFLRPPEGRELEEQDRWAHDANKAGPAKPWDPIQGHEQRAWAV